MPQRVATLSIRSRVGGSDGGEIHSLQTSRSEASNSAKSRTRYVASRLSSKPASRDLKSLVSSVLGSTPPRTAGVRLQRQREILSFHVAQSFEPLLTLHTASRTIRERPFQRLFRPCSGRPFALQATTPIQYYDERSVAHRATASHTSLPIPLPPATNRPTGSSMTRPSLRWTKS